MSDTIILSDNTQHPGLPNVVDFGDVYRSFSIHADIIPGLLETFRGWADYEEICYFGRVPCASLAHYTYLMVYLTYTACVASSYPVPSANQAEEFRNLILAALLYRIQDAVLPFIPPELLLDAQVQQSDGVFTWAEYEKRARNYIVRDVWGLENLPFEHAFIASSDAIIKDLYRKSHGPAQDPAHDPNAEFRYVDIKKVREIWDWPACAVADGVVFLMSKLVALKEGDSEIEGVHVVAGVLREEFSRQIIRGSDIRLTLPKKS